MSGQDKNRAGRTQIFFFFHGADWSMKTWRMIAGSRKGLVREWARGGDGSKKAGLRGRADSYRMHGQCHGGQRWVQTVEASPRSRECFRAGAVSRSVREVRADWTQRPLSWRRPGPVFPLRWPGAEARQVPPPAVALFMCVEAPVRQKHFHTCCYNH